MPVEDVATGDRQRVAAEFPAEVGQEVVVQGRRWVVVEANPPGATPWPGSFSRG